MVKVNNEDLMEPMEFANLDLAIEQIEIWKEEDEKEGRDLDYFIYNEGGECIELM